MNFILAVVPVVNGVKVEAFPSHHVDTMRGLDRVKCIMSDETDYYPRPVVDTILSLSEASKAYEGAKDI